MCRSDARALALAGVNLAIFTAAVWTGWLVADSLIKARDRWMTGVE